MYCYILSHVALWFLCSNYHSPRYPWREVKLLQPDSFTALMKKLRSRSISGRSLLQGNLVHSFPGKKGPWYLHVQYGQLFCWSELQQGELWSKPLTDILAWDKERTRLPEHNLQDFPQGVSYTSNGTFAQETAYSETFPLLLIKH